jgi:hypothetical protein
MQAPTITNSKKSHLQKQGYRDLKHALENPDNIYIGRKQRFIEGTFDSPFANPYSVTQYGRAECMEMYRRYIQANPDLLKKIPELSGKTMFCWCCPAKCHGDILIELFNANKGSNE